MEQRDRNSMSLLLSTNVSEEETREFGLEVAREFLKEVDDFAKSVAGGYMDSLVLCQLCR